MFTSPPARIDVSRRSGATILEVMFAIGVLLFGLVGIAAVIPAAGKLARNSIDYTRGVSVATNASELCKSYGMNDLGRLAGFDDIGNSILITNVSPPPNFLCIDPLFTSVNSMDTSRNSDYAPRFFPYYNPQMIAAAVPTTRMVRCSLTRQLTNGSKATISPKLAERICFDMDQLSFFQPKDKTLFPAQVFSSSSDQSFTPRIRSTNPVYSWLLTLHRSDARTATANIVIVKSRDLLAPDDLSAPSPNKLSERIAIATSTHASFHGGAGGRITLSFPGNVDTTIRSGSWIMLMQEAPSIRHAWFRVVQTASTEDLLGPNIVQCSVQGPDWNFTNPTTAAILENVVAVVEFPLNLVSNN